MATRNLSLSDMMKITIQEEIAGDDGKTFLMDQTMKPLVSLKAFGVILLLISMQGCIDEPVVDEGNIAVHFELTTRSALSGRIEIQEVYLKPYMLDIVGDAYASKSIPADTPPFRLIHDGDSSTVSLSLPPGAYNRLDIIVSLPDAPYELTAIDDTEPEPPGEAPNENFDNVPPPPDTPPNTGDNNGNNEKKTGADDNDTSNGSNDDEKTNDGKKEEDDNSKDRDDNKHKDKGKTEDNKDKGKKDDKKHHDHDDKRHHDHDDDDDDKEKKKKKEKKDKKKGHGAGRISAPDLQHFFQNARPGLIAIARYSEGGESVTMIFAVTKPLRFTAEQEESKTPFVLQTRSSARITLNPEKWFSDISDEVIKASQTQTFQDQEVLFIHHDYNTELYEKLLSRIQGSASVTFQSEADF